MWKCCVLLFLLLSVTGSDAQSLPLTLTPPTYTSANGACPSTTTTRANLQSEARTLLRNTVVPSLQSRPPCHCGGPGDWTRVVHLDMNDPTHQCPAAWGLVTSPVRACTQTSSGCNSAIFSTNNMRYSRVCGRIVGYQHGTTDAFQGAVDPAINNPFEGAYIDGISLSHGPAGSRQHIWSFASAADEQVIAQWPQIYPSWICPCTNININWPYAIPSYVGNNYFCDSGNRGGGLQPDVTYTQDPLWDGAGCGPTSTCCTLNNPPWFCTTLPQPTRNNLELRICQAHAHDEETFVNLVEIYVQ